MTSIPTTTNPPDTAEASVGESLDERLRALDLAELRTLRGDGITAEGFDNSFDNSFDNIGY